MENKKTQLYHIHRRGNIDQLWQVGQKMVIDDSFNALFYTRLLEVEGELLKRHKDYDIDYFIAMMEEMQTKRFVEDDLNDDFNLLLDRCYFFRREKALEEGRKIFNPSAPSRFHSIFLTDRLNINYWQKLIGDLSFETFLLELDGKTFTSSDDLFPKQELVFEFQVEQSEKYWRPKQKMLTLHKEVLFQGEAKIIR